MGFVSICTALYDYQPQSNGELELAEGDILYILEKSTEDNWWKAKKRAAGEDEDEPEGLIPNNYVEDAQYIHTARALYDYARQTEEEVSFSEDAVIHVYDVSDPDWTLVAVDGDYGFAPANYIEITDASTNPRSPQSFAPSSRNYAAAEPEQQPSPPASPMRDHHSAASRLADVLGGVAPASPPATRTVVSPPLPPRQLTPEGSDDEPAPPPMPRRPQSQTVAAPAPSAYYGDDHSGIRESPAIRVTSPSAGETPLSPGGFHLYNISEMVSAMGKRKKMPITLGLNVATGTIMLSPEKSRDGPTQEWTADKLEHYSMEGKHVFLELNRPSKSLDLHAGAKDTAREIVSTLGDIAGAHRASGLKEVITASGGQKKGVVLYDFMAQGEDEVTVGEGDEVVVLDDTKSEEWWNVRRLKNGKEGVVPSSYIEITGTINVEPPNRSGVNAGLSTVEQNRLEEQRLAKEAARADRNKSAAEQARASREVSLPERDSSLADEDHRSSKKDKKSSKSSNKPRSQPDQTKVRTWTDHSGSFKVEAQFLGVADGKIHLHKINGVKIAVPVSKMSQPDLDYVEKVTNEPIDDNIPVADLIKMKRRNQTAESSRTGASIERTKSPSQPNKPPDYDWFDFFLTAGVGPHQCERYAQAMVKDSMDETVLPDITMETLRMLGIKEGDALKVMKHLDQRYGRNRANGENADGQAAGLFSGPGGALKNNTSRQRPEANRSASDTVNPDVFQPEHSKTPIEARATPQVTGPAQFDDDAWTPKPSMRPAATPTPPPAPAPAPARFSENMHDLSTLLDKPLEPTPAAPPRPASQPQVSQPTLFAPLQQPMQTGATPQLFQQVANQMAQPIQPQQSGVGALPQIQSSRQRPVPPQQTLGSSLLSPPPRPLSAPQNAQQNQFGLQPLQPQLTGVPSNTHPAPPGQSLDELTAQRMQQYLRPQQTGYVQNGFQPQPTGFPQQQFPQMQQPFLNGNAAGSPFADPRIGIQPQPTGFNNYQQTGLQSGGINAALPPALIPQRTGFTNQPPQIQQNGINQFQPQQTGFQPGALQMQPTGFQPSFQLQQTGFPQTLQPQPTGFAPSNGFGSNNFPPVPPIPQHTPSPLVPQKTGAPDIKFGVKKLQPQPTGRRANLAQASKLTDLPSNQAVLTMDSTRQSIWFLSAFTVHNSKHPSAHAL